MTRIASFAPTGEYQAFLDADPATFEANYEDDPESLLMHESREWLETMIDTILASPERYARHLQEVWGLDLPPARLAAFSRADVGDLLMRIGPFEMDELVLDDA